MSINPPRLALTLTTLALTVTIPLSACASENGPTERSTVNTEPAITDVAAAVDTFDPLQAATLSTVVNGEQVFVTIGGVEYPVQLIGVDVPDSHSDEALELVESTVAESGSQNLWLEFDDPLGRLDDTSTIPTGEPENEGSGNISVKTPGLQAYVWTSHPMTGEPDQMLNLVQIEVGLAAAVHVDTSSYHHEVQFRRAEGYARDRGFGVWAGEVGIQH